MFKDLSLCPRPSEISTKILAQKKKKKRRRRRRKIENQDKNSNKSRDSVPEFVAR